MISIEEGNSQGKPDLKIMFAVMDKLNFRCLCNIQGEIGSWVQASGTQSRVLGWTSKCGSVWRETVPEREGEVLSTTTTAARCWPSAGNRYTLHLVTAAGNFNELV